MPGTITDDIEIIDAGHGGGADVPAGGDDDGEASGGGPPRIPQRAYFTAIQLGAGRHRHVLHGADQFLPGAQGPGQRLGRVRAAARALVQHADPARQQRHHCRWRDDICAKARVRRVPALVGAHHGLGLLFLGRPVDRLARNSPRRACSWPPIRAAASFIC